MNKSHIRKKKAFTLTELLVVVIVIGVLSAVVLPKFSKVLETRKTTEAEELMAAVRTEQEKRCILDHPYTGSFKVLGQTAEDTAKLESKYYTYALKQGGAEASSKGKAYTLELESYKDGRFCCSGPYCSSLNKDYPTCEELKGLSDYQGAEGTCLASLCEVSRECNPGETGTRSCECGSQRRTCDGECQWGSYTGTCYSKYGGTGATRACASGCGTQTSVSTCSGESWSGSCWSPSGGRTETKSCEELQSNLRGTARRYCSGTCSGSASCPGWDMSGCGVCVAPAGEASSQSCPSGYTGTQTRSWNTSTCSWGEWQGACTPVPTCSDASYKASHKAECCPSVTQSDNVCYQDCNCGLQARSTENRKAVSTNNMSACRLVNGQCKWTVPPERGLPSSCSSSYVLSIHPSEGSVTCTWAENPRGGNSGCRRSDNGQGEPCYRYAGANPPTYVVYKQDFVVENTCDRCRNGW